ncbi:MAG: hypothetical protein IKU10_08265 [Clostridia bacterium]|nr:hypothetical protein [Clostridia bacterium]
MEDLSAMLSNIMNDPGQMAKLQAMAGSLFGGETPPAPSKPDPPAAGLDISPTQMAGLMKMVGLLKNNTTDHRANVLLSLRPYLSEHRQKRVDDAVKLLRVVSILPAIKDAGIF